MNHGVLITARLKSQRLPKKIIKNINEDNIITFLIKRLKFIFKKKRIVLITSNSNQDKILEVISKSQQINIYKGDPLDVLMRMYKAAKKFKFKNFISCTADNPFTDANYAKKLMSFHLRKKNDLTIMNGLPIGTFSYAVNTKGLKKVIDYKLSKNTETWIGYFVKNKNIKVGYFNTNFNYRSVSKKLRLTVDYTKDLKFIREILKKTKKSQPTLYEVISILKKNPLLMKINSNVHQKKISKPIFNKKYRSISS